MNILKKLTTGASTLAIVATSALSASAGELNIMTWEGYTDASFTKPFEEATGCKVNATFVGSNDDFAPKLAAGGGVYDLVSPSIDSTDTLIKAGFIEPVDTSKITEWNNIYEKFRTAEAFNQDGKTYSVPFIWGAISFMYRTDKIKTAPTSLSDLWNADYKGKISLWDDKSAIYVAARLNGVKDIYNMSDEELAAAKETLLKQKPLVRKYWVTAGELVDLFAAGEVWISNTWAGFQSAQLAKQNIPVAEFIPKERAEGWIDSFMIVKDSPNLDCAYKFLNMITSEAGQCGLYATTGYSMANPSAVKKCMTPEQFSAAHQDDLGYLDELVLWKNLGERIGAYTNAWNSVKSQ